MEDLVVAKGARPGVGPSQRVDGAANGVGHATSGDQPGALRCWRCLLDVAGDRRQPVGGDGTAELRSVPTLLDIQTGCVWSPHWYSTG